MLAVAAGVLAYVTQIVARHTIDVVQARDLLPRWDLATHLGHGWLDYHLLMTGRIPQLLWDLWLQGYWPPVLSLFQVPFYVVLGGDMTSGLWSGLVALVLIGLTGSTLLWRLWGSAAFLAASLFIALLTSSPFLLAYASVTMTETLGALAQLVVLLAYAAYRESPTARTARLFALSLTLLFFTKYNYFILLVLPLVIFEWLERTSGSTAGQRVAALWRWPGRLLSTPTGTLLALYFVALLILLRTGGFEFRLLGQRVSVRSIGNSGHIVLYLLLARLWYLHHRGRIDWRGLTSADVRIRPLLVWFVLPVTIWMASPYPNHIRDFANLVINRRLGESTVEAGTVIYLDALRASYFYSEWLLAFVVIAFVVAAVRYGSQPPVMQWLIIAIPLQFAVIALHQTRFPRFLLLTVVLLCLAASIEVGGWFASVRRGGLIAVLLAPLVVVCAVVAARQVVTEERFRVVAFELYTDSPELGAALAAIREEIDGDDRLVVVGQSNELSPALFRWELGPPAGESCFPFELAGAHRLDLEHASHALLIEPLGSAASPLDATTYYAAQRRAVLDRVERGEFVLNREMPLANLNVSLRSYERVSSAAANAPCR
jgi:hypothetical protein